jgi:hypothetical protein
MHGATEMHVEVESFMTLAVCGGHSSASVVYSLTSNEHTFVGDPELTYYTYWFSDEPQSTTDTHIFGAAARRPESNQVLYTEEHNQTYFLEQIKMKARFH